MMDGAGAGPRHSAPPRGAGVPPSPAQPRPEHPVVARQHPATQVYLHIYIIYNIYIDIYNSISIPSGQTAAQHGAVQHPPPGLPHPAHAPAQAVRPPQLQGVPGQEDQVNTE